LDVNLEVIEIINGMTLISETLFLNFQGLEVVYEIIAVKYTELIKIENKGS